MLLKLSSLMFILCLVTFTDLVNTSESRPEDSAELPADNSSKTAPCATKNCTTCLTLTGKCKGYSCNGTFKCELEKAVVPGCKNISTTGQCKAFSRSTPAPATSEQPTSTSAVPSTSPPKPTDPTPSSESTIVPEPTKPATPTTKPATPTTKPATPTTKPATTQSTSSTIPSKSSTVIPSITTQKPPTPSHSSGRRFDAPSFIGGIILSFGLIGVCYIAFKFYKARTERNYHTLHETVHM